MADCKPNGKIDQLAGENLSSMSNILRILSSAFKLIDRPATSIPPYILLIGARNRKGMSARNITANMIARVEAEAGIPMGDVFADAPNREKTAFLIKNQEIVSSMTTDGYAKTVIEPGAIQITVASPYGPLQGSNLLPVPSDGVIG